MNHLAILLNLLEELTKIINKEMKKMNQRPVQKDQLFTSVNDLGDGRELIKDQRLLIGKATAFDTT